MKKLILIIFLISNIICFSQETLVNHINQNIKGGDIFSINDELASEKYEGRLSGTTGFDLAADYVANIFKEYKISPILNYKQSFPLNYTKTYEASLELFFNNNTSLKCQYYRDFAPMSFCGSGNLESEIVFAGYGISAPEYGYDDFKDIDVKGKVVMIIKGCPKAKNGEDWSKYDSHRFRTKNTREHGASGLIYVYTDEPGANPNGDFIKDFPIVEFRKSLADSIFSNYNLNTNNLKVLLNQRKNISFKLDIKCKLGVKSENFDSKGYNVIGYIEGSDSLLKNEFIVIGAHLDHCGKWPILISGADDNASGSATVIEIAKCLSLLPEKPKRSIAFILFGGEEMGMLGSDYFIKNIPKKMTKINYMINLDMIGVGPDMFVKRLHNYKNIEDLFIKSKDIFSLKCGIEGSKEDAISYGGDDFYFLQNNIPSITFFSTGGKRNGYHTPGDNIYWITPKIMEDIAKIITYTSYNLAN